MSKIYPSSTRLAQNHAHQRKHSKLFTNSKEDRYVSIAQTLHKRAKSPYIASPTINTKLKWKKNTTAHGELPLSPAALRSAIGSNFSPLTQMISQNSKRGGAVPTSPNMSVGNHDLRTPDLYLPQITSISPLSSRLDTNGDVDALARGGPGLRKNPNL